MEITIAASIPTRGDVDIQPIFPSLIEAFPGQPTLSAFYNNSSHINFQVFSRYVHAQSMQLADYIYTQDDDCIVPIEDLLASPVVRAAIDQNQIICNMPESHYANYCDTPEKLVGFGCLFPSKLIAPTFNRYLELFPIDSLLLREADRIFTGLNTNSITITHHPVHHLPHATSPTRMYHDLSHNQYRTIARNRVLEILTGSK